MFVQFPLKIITKPVFNPNPELLETSTPILFFLKPSSLFLDLKKSLFFSSCNHQIYTQTTTKSTPNHTQTISVHMYIRGEEERDGESRG